MVELREIKALPTLMRWRIEVLRNVFGVDPGPRLLVANRIYYRNHIADGSHIALVASEEGEDAGCGAVCFSDELPSPDNPTGHCAYIMNVYVREKFRRHGIARKIIEKLIEEAEKRDCRKIYLETTEEGRPVYESVGFVPMPDMMKLSVPNLTEPYEAREKH